MLSVAAAWSPCPWRGLHVHAMLSVSVACSLWCALHVRGVLSMSVEWPLFLWRGLHVCGVVSVSVAWSLCPWCGGVSVACSPCPWHGLRVRGVVSVSVAWWSVHGVVSLSVAWSPCQQHGLHGRSVVSVAVFSICCITLGLLASYLPMDVFTRENRPAEQILPHGFWHRYRLYRSHTLW